MSIKYIEKQSILQYNMNTNFLKFANFMNESFNENLYRRIYAIAYNNIKEDKKFMFIYFGAFISTVWMKCGLKNIPVELIEACKNVIIDVYFDGLEPEWDNDDVFNWWESISVASFEILTEPTPRDKPSSPYIDKTLPFLHLKKEFKCPKDICIYQI